MKGLKKILVTAAALIMCFSAAANAETDEDLKLFEDFKGWTPGDVTTAVAENYGYSGGATRSRVVIKDIDGDKKLGTRNSQNLKKTFSSPYTGLFGFEYDAVVSEFVSDEKGTTGVVSNGIALYTTLNDGTESFIRFVLTNKTAYLQGKSGFWSYTDLGVKPALDNHVKIFVNCSEGSEDTLVVSFKDVDNKDVTKKLTIPVDVKNISGISMAAIGNVGTAYDGTPVFTLFDNISVYQRDTEVLPELTYIDEDFHYDPTGFFGAYIDGYSKLKYYCINSQSNIYSISDEAKKYINFDGNRLNVGYWEGAPGKRNTVLMYLPASQSGIFDISFDAQHGSESTKPAYIEFFGTAEKDKFRKKCGIYIRPESENSDYDRVICVGHEYGVNGGVGTPNLGAVIKKTDITKPNHYRIVLDTVNFVYDLYIDDVYYGAYASYEKADDPSNDLVRVGFSNVIIDNLVVKKAELLREYHYDFKDNESTNPNRSFNTITDLAGKTPVVKMTISNPTELDKSAVLVSAIYDGSGKLVSVAASEQQSLTSELTSFEAVHSETLPGDCTGYYEKSFVFESLPSLTPIYDAIKLN